MTPDRNDRKVIANAQEIASIAEPQVRETIERFRALPFREQRSIATEVVSRLWGYRNEAVGAGGRLVARLVVQGISRVKADIDQALSSS